ncbi:hypothetical protein SMMN14_01346 [Sphaerulina musiva]
MPVAVTAIQKKSGMLATSWLRDDGPAVDLTETFTVSRPSTTCFYLQVEAAPEVLSKPRLKLSSMAPWMRPCEGPKVDIAYTWDGSMVLGSDGDGDGDDVGMLEVPIGGNARAGTVAGHDGNAMQ